MGWVDLRTACGVVRQKDKEVVGNRPATSSIFSADFVRSYFVRSYNFFSITAQMRSKTSSIVPWLGTASYLPCAR